MRPHCQRFLGNQSLGLAWQQVSCMRLNVEPWNTFSASMPELHRKEGKEPRTPAWGCEDSPSFPVPHQKFYLLWEAAQLRLDPILNIWPPWHDWEALGSAYFGSSHVSFTLASSHEPISLWTLFVGMGDSPWINNSGCTALQPEDSPKTLLDMHSSINALKTSFSAKKAEWITKAWEMKERGNS